MKARTIKRTRMQLFRALLYAFYSNNIMQYKGYTIHGMVKEKWNATFDAIDEIEFDGGDRFISLKDIMDDLNEEE